MSWREKRKQVKDKLDKFAEINQTTMTTEQLVTLRTDHEQLRTSLTNYLKEQAQNYELSNKLEKTGTLQTQIRELEEEKDRLQQDVDTALARDKVLRTRN
jgi:predicted nuclease with TOPRIM domain